MNIFYTVYKVTNSINGKIYIGAHKTHDVNDSYLGSGRLILKAIAKHGTENFSKEILHVFETEQEMFDAESELVTEEFVKLDTNYNIDLGGKGGGARSEEVRKKIAESMRIVATGKTHSAESKAKMSVAHKGKKLSNATKLKISKATKGFKMPEEDVKRRAELLRGIPRSESAKASMRSAFINTPDKVCPHCQKSCKPAPYKRWHGDNCRMKEIV
ncbi:putative Seg-like homing DNA endonuclease [Acinetobacter phage Acj61]|jgi:group I intron endonuclease|uniref:Putative Seg-like homing DNA endonuclease n=1 Tax=Acinetobacter phage Acj61 TaxID=760732 RepID=E5E4D7_9CAUD|nr:homing endonuclease [Acinetobacter phage Acj61]ADG36121.1 putative Seg-like homing DNA endonuclease [Acinetobacter phage Acj61]